MNLFQKLALWAGVKAAGYSGVSFTLADSDLNQKLSSFWGIGGTHTGKSVTEKTAMQVTTVWACVRLLAETMGAMPSSIHRAEKGGNSTKTDDHPLHEILVEQPNDDMNGLEYRESRTANLALRGNAYSIIERRGGGDVSSLYPIPAGLMKKKRDQSTNWEIRYGVEDRGRTEWYPPEKIWHTKGFSFNGLEGLSPIGYAREAMGLALAGEEFNARLFGQGLRPSALVSIPQWLNPEQRVEANKKLLEMHTGAHNMNKPMLLEGGMKVESGLITPDDAQFLQLRQFTVVELCRLFGVKPHMIAALERATDNNIEQLSLEFVTYTMLPYMRRDEIGARKLFKPSDRSKYFYRYNADGLLRADSAARAALYSILLQNGVVNRNYVRSKEGLNTVADPAMDQYTVQSNMAMIDQLVALVAARNAPPAAAPNIEPRKEGDTSINIALPTSLEHKLAQSIDVPGIKELATQVKRSNDANSEAAKDLRDSIKTMTKIVSGLHQDSAKSMVSAISELKAEVRKPRKAKFDELGNPIGTESVDTLQ